MVAEQSKTSSLVVGQTDEWKYKYAGRGEGGVTFSSLTTPSVPRHAKIGLNSYRGHNGVT